MKDKNKKEKIDYVSLCKAAKISGYAQDYLSLLCRQGKLKGEKIGRNWVTTYQWLDEYQRNLISDMGLKKNSIAPEKDFKETENVEKNAGKIEKIEFFRSIKITYSRLLLARNASQAKRSDAGGQRCKRAELVLAASLFFLILLGGFGYAKNSHFFSDFTPLEIMSRGLSQLDNNAKKISISKINLKPKFLTGLAEQVYQTKNRMAYRMSKMKDNNIYSLQTGEKLGKTIVNVPMKIGNEIEKGFAKSDLILNSSFRKTHLAFQNGVNNFSKGVLVFFGTADKEKEFGRVAGVSTSVETETQQNLLSLGFDRIADAYVFTSKNLADGFNNFSQKTANVFGDLKKNIRLAINDTMDVFEKGIILCKTTLTIQPGDKKFDEKIPDKFTEQNQILENQKQEVIQVSLEELFETANDKTKDALIVLPVPESEKEKEKLKEKIELSFSDEVKIKPEDKNSGIITPVFQKSKGDDYLYLLIPMKEKIIK
jgi:hypothetical protein